MDTQADLYEPIRKKWDANREVVNDLVNQMLVVGQFVEDKSGFQVFLKDAEDLFHWFLGDRFLQYKNMDEEELKRFYRGKGAMMNLWDRALNRVIAQKY